MGANKSLFAITTEWVDDEEVKGEEFRATMARLRIDVGSVTVTYAQEKDTNTFTDNLLLPVYPLAEWIATNWWHLGDESPHSNRTSSEFESRHNFSLAGGGYPLPNLSALPEGENVFLKYRPKENKYWPVSFLRAGEVQVSLSIFREALGDFLTSVVERLKMKGIQGTLLQIQWDDINSLTSPERDFCRFAAKLGHYPLTLDDDQQQSIVEAAALLPDPVVDEFFSGAMLEEGLVEQAMVLNRFFADAGRSTEPRDRLNGLRGKLRQCSLHGAPWNKGYQAAATVRQMWALDGKLFVNQDDIIGFFELPEDMFAVDPGETSQVIDGAYCLNKSNSLEFNMYQTSMHSKKFTFFRILHDYVFDYKSNMGLATRGYSARQKQNRAFAAEILAPAEYLKKRFKGKSVVSWGDIENITNELNISDWVVAHQLKNHNIAEVSQLGL